MTKVYTKEQHEWLAAFIPGHKADEIVEAFNARYDSPKLTASKVKSYKLNHHIPSGTKKGKGLWSGPLWTKEMADFVIANNKGRTNKEMAELVSKTFHKEINDKQIKAIRGRLKIDSGLTGHFTKDDPRVFHPQKGYHAPGAEKGWFQKGHTPWNHAKVGDEAWTTDGYLKVKIAEPNKWEFKHVLEWEQHNGPVPKDHVVSFKDGNHANCAIENLVLLTRGEHAMLNHLGLRCSDPEITEAGITLARLQSKVYNATKKLNKQS